jgi:pilus assembly protein CpaB
MTDARPLKKNLAPLLGIAFVVALISTGVFYGLFAGRLRATTAELPKQTILVAARKIERGAVVSTADLRASELRSARPLTGSFSRPEQVVGATVLEPVEENEPLTSRVTVHGSRAGGPAGVPAGMRALSIHVSGSSGVLSLLRPGYKVDIQALADRGNALELRTILQNIEVLSIAAQAEAGPPGYPAGPAITVLTRPEDSDVLALADAAGRLRLALRNPLDLDARHRPTLALAALFSPAVRAAPIRPAGPALDLSVRVLGISEKAAGELTSSPANSQTLRISPFPRDVDANELVARLERNHQGEVFASRRLVLEGGRPSSVRAEGEQCSLRLQFAMGGAGRLRVQPELAWRAPQGTAARRLDTEVDWTGKSAFLLSGFGSGQPSRAALESLYPGRSWNGRELIVVVSRGVGR